MSGFTFVDIFAGIGGLRLPFDEFGGECVFSCDKNKFAAETYAANYDCDSDFVLGDIRNIDAEDIPPHDILLAGVPCQGFSIAGVSRNNSLGRSHGFNHNTGYGFFEVARLLKHHKPKAFLLENVEGLLRHNRGKSWEKVKAILENLGYTIDSKVIDANLVVPQRRKRLYIVGFKNSVNFEWPEIEAKERKLKEILEPNVDQKYTLRKTWDALKKHRQRHHEKGNGFGYSLFTPDTTKTSTLPSRYYKDGADILLEQPGKNPRRLTPRECSRLMGFPDEFKIPVSDTQAYQQFGNAVVPLISKPIAEKILEAISIDKL